MYDGDTLYADVDLGMYTWKHDQELRLFGIDTPEIYPLRTREAGTAARDFLCAALLGIPVEDVGAVPRKVNHGRTRLILNVPVFIWTLDKDMDGGDDKGKYGRWLTMLWIERDGELINLNELMLTSGHAVVPAYS